VTKMVFDDSKARLRLTAKRFRKRKLSWADLNRNNSSPQLHIRPSDRPVLYKSKQLVNESIDGSVCTLPNYLDTTNEYTLNPLRTLQGTPAVEYNLFKGFELDPRSKGSNGFERLPSEIVINILQYLSLKQLVKCSGVRFLSYAR
jgi:hypothetical protein